MTAADYQALVVTTAAAVASVEAITAAATQRGAFDYDAPLPPLNIRPQNKLWEPAAQHYRDLETKS